MTDAEFRRYRFASIEQWHAAAIAGARVGDNGLAPSLPLRCTPILGTDAADATSALDFDAGGRLTWVRPSNAKFYRLYEFGAQAVGRLFDGTAPRTVVAGARRIWLATQHGLNRYAERHLQFLGQLWGGRSNLAAAGDGCDGVWLLEGGDGRPASLVHLDSAVRLAQSPIRLPTALDQAAIAVSRCGRSVVVLDPNGRTTAHRKGSCMDGRPWALLIVDTCTDAVRIVTGMTSGDRYFHPTLVAIDHADEVHLVDAASGRLITLSLSGDVLAETILRLPGAALPLQGVAARSSLAVAGANGLFLANPTLGRSDGILDVTATLITPTLISPEGQTRGWQRADIDVLLPEGTTLAVTPATTRDRAFATTIDQIFADSTLSPAAKAQTLDQRLSWETDRRIVFTGAPPQDRVRLHYALHEIDAQYLWLRIDLHAPPSRQPPSLRCLDVLYPNLSYIDHLPAVYRRNPQSAMALRRFVALFEGLFGDLDATIDGLPRSIDPATAPDEWLPLLLGWLGFPPLPSLSPDRARTLLMRAGDLLARRGTMGALQDALSIVTGRPVAIDDAAVGPPPWLLPTNAGANAGAGEPPRLGRDTLILTRDATAPFALGWSASLGKVPLGQGCTLGVSAFVRQSGFLTIRIAAPTAERERLTPLVAALLPHFVPAHCRSRIDYVPATMLPRTGRLDQDLRLAGQKEPSLGLDFVLGCRHLPSQPADGAMIGRTTALDCGLHLS